MILDDDLRVEVKWGEATITACFRMSIFPVTCKTEDIRETRSSSERVNGPFPLGNGTTELLQQKY